MATQTLKLNVKSGEKDGKNFWDRCGVLFVNTDDRSNITSINVKHSMFPDVEMSPSHAAMTIRLPSDRCAGAGFPPRKNRS
ncbi:hypothetical protein SAMN05444000_13415 [Shimia gijangensis]|uniref:Uncharacterized protein n=1 Tax=Shimia gijangensis TaxID=1470563 RepID=A0A1M6T286_9RHOB|nr:hypothetical protein [Shimia gijangensis]SHK51037.1 hypothetical protein SAMN05444000_13415 [Shimia gijangensis]